MVDFSDILTELKNDIEIWQQQISEIDVGTRKLTIDGTDVTSITRLQIERRIASHQALVEKYSNRQEVII